MKKPTSFTAHISFTHKLLEVCHILLHNGVNGDFSKLIGHKWLVTKTNYSNKLPGITRVGVSLLVHSNLSTDSIVSRKVNNVILDFSVKSLKLSYPFSIQPRRVNFNGAVLCLVNLSGEAVTIKSIICPFYCENLQ